VNRSLSDIGLAEQRRGGFTLVEMLAVMAIMAILAVLAVPAIEGLNQSQSFSGSISGLSDSLNFARSYAVAQNTYVYVGFTELDRTQGESASPQVPGVGRVAVSLIATKDGTSDSSSWDSSGADVELVRPVEVFDFLHIASAPFPTASTGPMARPSGENATALVMPASVAPALPFSLPLGSTPGSGKYNFSNESSQVICFNPQGQVLLPTTVAGSIVLQPAQSLELDIQPVKGSTPPALPTNVTQGILASVVVDGISGAITVYRP
jgi:prepilin-type N-terminal cleavage/methylation domain-containing protein